MLTGELVRPCLRLHGSELTIQMLHEDDPGWLRTATELIALFQQHVGQSQGALNKALERYEGERTDYVIVRGLAKVLADAATFMPVATALSPVALRELLFARGPAFSSGASAGTSAEPSAGTSEGTLQVFHSQTRHQIIESVAAELSVRIDQVEEALFADRSANWIVRDAGPSWTPEGLLARYNLELARGVLYWASLVQIEVHGGYKDLWKYLKLFKLMFWVQPLEGGYLINLDGPISPFVSATTRYGRQFAAFLPALLLCEQWRLSAAVQPPQARNGARYRLDSTSSLRSHFKQSGPFDSRLEADFASEFETKFGGKRGQWMLTREDEVLVLGDTVMIPDFALTHKRDGRRILIELVGFWHPDYLRRKVAKLRAAQCEHLLLIVYEGVNLTPDTLRDIPSHVLYFKQKPVLKDVMQTVEAMSKRIYGPLPRRTSAKRSRSREHL